MEIIAGELVARTLKDEGVECVFGLCGGHVIPILEGLEKYGIRYVGTHHEAAAVHMADAWARYTGSLGVVMVTAGPGVANALAGVIAVNKASVPLLLLAGRAADKTSELEDGQELDAVAATAPVTKWARTCHSAARFPEYVSMAARQATCGRPGVAFLDFPLDLVNSSIEEDDVPRPQKTRTAAKPAGDPILVGQALDKLLAAQRPVILAGSGVNWSGGRDALNEFAAMSGVPVITWKMARGAVPDDSPLAAPLGSLPMADTVLVLGTRLDWMIGFGRPPMIAENAIVMQVDIEPEEIGHNRGVDIGIFGDVKVVLEQMMALMKGKQACSKAEGWPMPMTGGDTQKALASAGSEASGSINLIDLCAAVRAELDKDTIIMFDGGETFTHAVQFIPILNHNPCVLGNSFGQIGIGLPNAIAAKLANPDKKVVLIAGDGAFGIYGMELHTAIINDLDIHVIVANDAAWGMIQVDFTRWYKKTGCGTTIGELRYDKMFEAFGGQGYYAEAFDELADAVKKTIHSDKATLLNVRIDNSLSLQRTGRVSFA